MSMTRKAKPRDKGGGESRDKSCAIAEAGTMPQESPGQSGGLLPGWVKMKSKTKNRDYYYNERLKVSQWTKPTIDDEIKILVDQAKAKKAKANDGKERNILIAKRRLQEKDADDKSVDAMKYGESSSRKRVLVNDSQSSTKKSKVEAVVIKTHVSPAASEEKSNPEECEDVESVLDKIKQQNKIPKVFAAGKAVHKTPVALRSKGRHKNKSKGHLVPKAAERLSDNKVECKISTESQVEGKSEGPDSKVVPREWQKFLAKYRPHNVNNSNSSAGEETEPSRHRSSGPSNRASRNKTSPGRVLHETSQCSQSKVLPETSRPRGVVKNRSEPCASTSMISVSGQPEEAMDFEDYPEEYMKLISDIHVLREDFHNEDSNGSGQLASAFLVTSASTNTSATHTSDTGNKQTLYIVIDTNVLMNSLKFVSCLKDQIYSCHHCPCLVIPWVVIKELDQLKDNRNKRLSEDAQTQARHAVRYLHEHFEQGDPLLVGQKPSEAKEKFEELGDASNNDDKILQCCVQWKTKYPTDTVFLLTGDIHLRTKAIILELPAYSEKSLLNWINSEKAAVAQKETNISKTADQGLSHSSVIPNTVQSHDSSQAAGTRTSLTATNIAADFSQDRARSTSPQHMCVEQDTMQCGLHPAEKRLPPLQSSTKEGPSRPGAASISRLTDRVLAGPKASWSPSITKRRLKTNNKCNTASKASRYSVEERVLRDVRELVRTGLGELLETEMRKAYDDIWKMVVYRKPPWSLEDILMSLKKHWIAVFGNLLGRHNSDCVQDLLSASARAQSGK